jgi:ribonuclease J
VQYNIPMPIKNKEYNAQVYNEYVPELAPGYYFIPLGGTNMIGMNFNVFGIVNEDKTESWIICDIGISILQEHGVKLEMASPYALAHKKIDGIIITHAHDDHIAGLVYILDLFKNDKTLFDRTNKTNVYMTQFATDVIAFKLEKHTSLELKKRSTKGDAQYEFDQNFIINVAKCNVPIIMGLFRVTLLNITHSTLESNMIKIEFSYDAEHFDYTLLHTADWKDDCTPVLGEPANLQLIKQNCKQIDMLLCDSTNADRPGITPSESTIEPYLLNLLDLYKNCSRIFVTFFATNVARIKTAFAIARQTNRQIALYGTTMNGIFEIAARHGYITADECSSVLKCPDLTHASMRDKRFLIICTGSQGEESSVLTRIAQGRFKYLRVSDTLNKQDTNTNPVVIFASNVIPGNEAKVAELKNSLLTIGCIVVDSRNNGICLERNLGNDVYLPSNKTGNIHVSGHPCRGDIAKLLVEPIAPRAFIPVHGDKMHTTAARDLVKQIAPQIHCLIVSDGNIVHLNARKKFGIWIPEVLPDKSVIAGRIGVDGYSLVPHTSPHLMARVTAGEHGVVVVVLQGEYVKYIIDVGCLSADLKPELYDVLNTVMRNKDILTNQYTDRNVRDDYDDSRMMQEPQKVRTISLKSLISKEIFNRFGKQPYVEIFYINN